jgi:hypothetical protein
MRVRSPKPGWLYVRLAWRRQLGRFNRWSPPPARRCRCLRCQRKRDAQARAAAEVERIFAAGAGGVDWRELLRQPDQAAVKAMLEENMRRMEIVAFWHHVDGTPCHHEPPCQGVV